ncbi:MAG: zinc ribbon domain-containing protein [Methanosarcinales archaeon]|nr:MAG: zinc ribbon domain-containing protein [Methanosarcinales archaeon]
MSEYEDEKLEATRGEKILASAMVVFLLIGGINVLSELEDIPETPHINAYYEKYGVYKLENVERSISTELRIASDALAKANDQYLSAKENYLFKREEYRVILDKGETDEVKEREYETAREGYEESQVKLNEKQAVYDEIDKRLDQKRGGVSAARNLARDEYNTAHQIYSLKVLAVRLAFVLPLLAVAIVTFLKTKKVKSKYTIHANAFMAFASLLLIYMIVVNVWEVVHVVGISILGVVACAISLAYLKKQFSSLERISMSRLKENKCPGCTFPIRYDMSYCQNCGKKLADNCQECGKMRSILTPFCPNCGSEKVITKDE